MSGTNRIPFDDRTAGAGFDAIMVVSFGGPEGPDEVVPFLQHVTGGRGIPAERLVEVGKHYFAFGGVSPINAQNRALVAALAESLAQRGVEVPVVLGNRHHTPYMNHALRSLTDQGCRRVLAVATSAYSSYSGCRHYREDLAEAVETVGVRGLSVVKLAPFWEFDGFVAAVSARLLNAFCSLPTGWPTQPEVLFTTHSIPLGQARTSGPTPSELMPTYCHQQLQVGVSALEHVRGKLGWSDVPPHQLVFQSRSGPPREPWLEPDVNDALEALAARGVRHVVVAPIGFLSDHMEVVWDLDTQARATAQGLGIQMLRVQTVGTHPLFVNGLAGLLAPLVAPANKAAETPTASAASRPAHPATPGLALSCTSTDRADSESWSAGPLCGRNCCPNPRGPRPTVAAVVSEEGLIR